MTSKDKHQKHPKLVRSTIGYYHRCEWAIYGTNCDNIRIFYDQVNAELDQVNILYVDADHSDKEKDTHNHIGKKQFSTIDVQPWCSFDDRLNTIQSDAAFVNGNHYAASCQIVIIDPRKKDSLKRREDQLGQIAIVVVENSEDEIYDFVKSRMTEGTVVYKATQINKIANQIAADIEKATPELKALILAGGQSQRMGFDKSQIEYHSGLSQQDYLYQLLSNKGINTYLSKRYDYLAGVESQSVITDRLTDMGPFGAIVSAMMTDPNAAWLVVACDLPFLDGELLDRLIQARNTSKFATAFRGIENPFPEPLITVYEPKAYQRFLSFMSLGYACPRKVLINSDIEEIVLEDMNAITNANTLEEMERAKSKLANE
ncbi:MAG: molybdopterin-guanine dinucleotide biosynthesis protein A [Saprospiraceae bacterium]|jgi:molybdopterin-guanine dinucleotide biosynthesis protein A|tara:strand:+ start:298 stop:1416 length:1119 start_codon:yes stop_codon:yes gene_type:complete